MSPLAAGLRAFTPDQALLAPCARAVESGDRDRFLATMAAPVAARPRLWPIYAVNLELARAPWAASQPLIAEMRLQWWIDALADAGAGKPARAHELAAPLAALIAAARLDPAALIAAAEARRQDCWEEPFADAQAVLAYLRATGAGPMQMALAALAADYEDCADFAKIVAKAQAIAGDRGLAGAMANWLIALPDLGARGRAPLGDAPDPALIADLAAAGLAALARARADWAALAAPKDLRRALAPGFFPGWQAGAVLRLAAEQPERALAPGGLQIAEFRRRGLLAWLALSGRW